MTPEKTWNVEYWSKQLLETTDEAAPILRKFYATSCAPLSIEETYKLRNVLEDYRSITTLLAKDLARPDPVVPFWKKLFRK